jgi:MFS family permease
MESVPDKLQNVDPDDTMCVRQRESIPLTEVVLSIIRDYPKRFVLGLALFIGQAFLYNAILFGYATLLSTFFHVSTGDAPYYLVAFAAGNLLGPIVLGPLFDSVGRIPMISGTYILSGVMLAITAYLFEVGVLNAYTQTLAWCVIFFFASAGASAAYLTVSEIFPLEVRAQAIAVFFAIAQGFGALGPVIYGHLIGDGKDHTRLFIGYLLGAGVMIVGGIVEIFLGIAAEGRSLEEIASPLSAVRKVPESLSGMTTGRLGVEGGTRTSHGTT